MSRITWIDAAWIIGRGVAACLFLILCLINYGGYP